MMKLALSADNMVSRLMLAGYVCLCIVGGGSLVMAAEANLNLVFTTTDAGGHYGERHVHVVWVETTEGSFVSTVGTNVGIERALWANSRAYSLNRWDAVNPDRGGDVDARTGATQTSYRSYNVNWDWRKRDGSVVPDGTYHLRFQCTNADSGDPSNLAEFAITRGSTPWTLGPVSQGGYNNIRLQFSPATLGVSTDEATEVTDRSARLNGTVTATGSGGNPGVYIYWGESDGGTDPGAWDNEIVLGTLGAGAFHADVSNLKGGGTYYYRCYVENATESVWGQTVSFKAISTTVVFAEGDVWKYFKGYSTPADWNKVRIDESGWLSGPMGIGYADGDDATVLGDMSGHYWTVYLRYTFNVDDPAGVEKMTFSADYDDGFVAYINGNEVMRRGFSEDQVVRFDTPSSSHGASVDGGDIAVKELTAQDIGYLKPGENVFAIEVHNTTLGSSDLTMIPELTMVGGLREPQGDVNLEPGELDFGEVNVADSAELAFDIENTGNLDLQVESISVTGLDKGVYSVELSPAVPFTLSAFEGKESVVVRFWPDGVQNYDYAQIAVGSDDPDEPVAVVSLKGSGGPTAPVAFNAVGGVGGSSRAVAIYKDYVLVGDGAVLTVYDAFGINGVAVLDVVGQITLADEVEDIAVSGDVAYVAAGLAGVQIVQLGDPSMPLRIAEYATDGFACDVAMFGARALVADGASVYVLDVSNAASPALTGRWNTDGRALGVEMDDFYGYVANGDRGIEVLSLGDGDLVANFDTPGVAYGISVVGGMAYVADGRSGLRIVDVSGLPGVLSGAGHLDTPGIATDVAVIGGRVCVADNVAGVSVVDISNPAQPKLYARSSGLIRSLSAAVAESRVLVGDDAGGLSVLAAQSRPGMPLGDTNGDNVVDIFDLTTMADGWLARETMLDVAAGNLNDDTIVNLADFATVAANWMAWYVNIPDLAAWWGFEEESGDIAVDSSGNGHEGALVHMSGGARVAGKSGNALAFDGVDDYVLVSGYKGIIGSSSRTVCAWIKVDSVDDVSRAIVSWGNDNTGGSWLFMLDHSGYGHPGSLRVSAVGGTITGVRDIRDGHWHHVAALLADDGNANVSEVLLYIDGVREEINVSNSVAVNTGNALGGVAAKDVRIGAMYRAGSEMYFEGLMDDVRIYDRALSEVEIAELAK